MDGLERHLFLSLAGEFFKENVQQLPPAPSVQFCIIAQYPSPLFPSYLHLSLSLTLTFSYKLYNKKEKRENIASSSSSSGGSLSLNLMSRKLWTRKTFHDDAANIYD